MDLLTVPHSGDVRHINSVRHFDNGYCRLDQACTGRGACGHSSGKCTCFVGHSLSDCSECSNGYFDPLQVNVAYPAKRADPKVCGLSGHAWCDAVLWPWLLQ